MKYSTVTLAAAFACTTLASPILARDSVPGVVQVPVTHKYGPAKSSGHSVQKKRFTNPFVEFTNPFVESLENGVTAYYAWIDVGTPGQTNIVQIDTGSSDLWVYSPSANATTDYNSADSFTYHYNNSDFSIQYVSGSASGDWVTDDVSWGWVIVTAQSFGVVSSAADGGNGVFGIGYISDESSRTPYINFPQNLVDQGYIAHNAYSLYLDNVTDGSGSILFGGVDSAKYTGQLYTVPVISPFAFEVTVSEVTVGSTKISGGSFGGILDSGTSFTYLPNAQFKAIVKALGATYVSEQGAYFLNELPANGVTYSFSGATVTVPPSELALNVEEYFGINVPGYTYLVPIFSSEDSDNYVILGDSFLRSAYVVYDLDNKEISIAQASWNSFSFNVEAITSTVPGAVSAPDA